MKGGRKEEKELYFSEKRDSIVRKRNCAYSLGLIFAKSSYISEDQTPCVCILSGTLNIPTVIMKIFQSNSLNLSTD